MPDQRTKENPVGLWLDMRVTRPRRAPDAESYAPGIALSSVHTTVTRLASSAHARQGGSILATPARRFKHILVLVQNISQRDSAVASRAPPPASIDALTIFHYVVLWGGICGRRSDGPSLAFGAENGPARRNVGALLTLHPRSQPLYFPPVACRQMRSR